MLNAKVKIQMPDTKQKKNYRNQMTDFQTRWTTMVVKSDPLLNRLDLSTVNLYYYDVSIPSLLTGYTFYIKWSFTHAAYTVPDR